MKQTIKKNRDQILQAWFRATIETYPSQSARVLGKDANRFDNPVGAVTRESLEDVLNLIIEGFDRQSLEKALDPVIRIRAVQAFEPADAVGFIFALKTIGGEFIDPAKSTEFDRTVDEIALAAFNRLMKCKEDIFLLKATESKRRIHRAFERAGLVAELSEEDLLGSNKS
ncbi:MAG: RsbRD N-terminal domain-containing protein [Desulfobacter sp.]|nr:MAG: RsbRD N-terminal domain-containing protein [Desulfobacter sp.]